MYRDIRLWSVLLLLLLLSVGAKGTASILPMYEVQDLGIDPWRTTTPTVPRINDRGQVILQRGDEVFRYSDEEGYVIVSPPGRKAYAFDIGAHGEVLVEADKEYRYTDSHGLQALPSGYWGRINENGVLCGSTTSNGRYGAATYDDNTGIHFLLPAGGYGSHASDINDRGEIVGYQYSTDNDRRVWLYTESTGLRYLPDVSGIYAGPSALNNSGHIVGTLYTSVSPYASEVFYRDSYGVRFLNTGGPNMWAPDINDSDQVVFNDGFSSQDPGDPLNRGRAFLFSPPLGTTRLNDMVGPLCGWDLYSATGINNAGEIVGRGWYLGAQHVFRLRPITSAVPEPTSLALIASALLPCVLLRRHIG